jgi:tryptophan synthase beta chain
MTKKTVLGEERIPRQWYNIVADLPTKPAPPLHPGTMTTWRRSSRWV